MPQIEHIELPEDAPDDAEDEKSTPFERGRDPYTFFIEEMMTGMKDEHGCAYKEDLVIRLNPDQMKALAHRIKSAVRNAIDAALDDAGISEEDEKIRYDRDMPTYIAFLMAVLGGEMNVDVNRDDIGKLSDDALGDIEATAEGAFQTRLQYHLKAELGRNVETIFDE